MSSPRRIRKAVFPVAGLGTRFLPATKSIPKEMLPIVDKPLIQYAVEEALDAGIDSLIFITSRKKHAIADHFDTAFELEVKLADDGKDQLLQRIQDVIPEDVSRAYVTQPRALGLGHAVWCARSVVGDEPFAVLLADDLVRNDGPGALRQMVEAWDATGAAQIGVQEVPREATRKYGIVAVEGEADGRQVVRTIVEKPEPENAPSRLGVVGRYILPPEIFGLLEGVRAGVGGEIQLTDAIAELIGRQPVHALAFEGQRYDCGSRFGFVKATLDFALEHEDMRAGVLEHMAAAVRRHGR